MRKFLKVKSSGSEWDCDNSQPVYINLDNIDMVLVESKTVYFNGGNRYVKLDNKSFEELIKEIKLERADKWAPEPWR